MAPTYVKAFHEICPVVDPGRGKDYVCLKGTSSSDLRRLYLECCHSVLCRLRIIAAHRDKFVLRLSICPSFTVSFIVTRRYISQATRALLRSATILVVVSARYAVDWIHGGAKVGRRGAPLFTKFSFRPNGHSNILMYGWRHMHTLESCHSSCLFSDWIVCWLLLGERYRSTWISCLKQQNRYLSIIIVQVLAFQKSVADVSIYLTGCQKWMF